MMIKTENFTPAAWQSYVSQFEKASKGKTLSDLEFTTSDGLTIHPLLETHSSHFLPRSEMFKIGASITHTPLAALKILEQLKPEHTFVICPQQNTSYGASWSAQEQEQLPQALNAYSKHNPCTLLLDPLCATQAHWQQNAPNLNIAIDPVGLSYQFLGFEPTSPQFQLHIDGTWLAASGANNVLELAYLLSYLNSHTQNQLACISINCTSEVLSTIAKGRAFKLLVQKLGLQMPHTIHMQTAFYQLADQDQETNILRNTYAAMAAIYSGANLVSMLPHNRATTLFCEDATRLSLTALNVLKYECDIAQTADSLSGATAIESLTAQMVQSAWAIFQTIEQLGGLTNPNCKAYIKQEIFKNKSLIAKSSSQILGVNFHPNAQETENKAIQIAPNSTFKTDPDFSPIRAQNLLNTAGDQA